MQGKVYLLFMSYLFPQQARPTTCSVTYLTKVARHYSYTPKATVNYLGEYYHPSRIVTFTNKKLTSLTVYKSEGFLSYDAHDLAEDRQLVALFKLPPTMQVVVRAPYLYVNRHKCLIESRKQDSLFVADKGRLILYVITP